MEISFSRTFEQTHAKKFLRGPLERGQFPSSLLISGKSGLGQEALALDLVQALLCESSEKKSCGLCRSCKDFVNGNQAQVQWLFPLAKSFQKTKESRMEGLEKQLSTLLQNPYEFSASRLENLSIEQIRDLKESLGYALEKGKKRVMVLFFAEYMLEPAANSLLKILEEPPSDSFFILTSSDKKRLLPTILSRCIHLPLEELEKKQLEVFADKLSPDIKENCRVWVDVSGGSPGELIKNAQYGPQLLQLALEFLALSLEDNWEKLLEFVESHQEFNEMDSALVLLKTSLSVYRQIYLKKSIFVPGVVSLSLDQKIAEQEMPEQLFSFLQNSLENISRYSKPSVAIIGNYMKWMDKGVMV